MNATMNSRTRLSTAVTLTFLLAGGVALAQTPAPAAPAEPSKSATAPAKVAAPGPQLPGLSVAQIVAKHVAARGSAEAWKGVHGLQLTGKLEAGKGSADSIAASEANAMHAKGKEATVATSLPAAEAAKPEVLLPFVMDFERPNKSRVEIEFQGKTAVQVYDGSHGWKVRPYLNRHDVEPFTADEAKTEAGRAEPEGPLVDYAAKGSKVELDGTDNVDGKGAYRLKITKKDKTVVHVWVDASTFLDVKIDGAAHRMDGKMRNTFVTQRDFRKVDGVLIPFVLETSIDGYPETHKFMIEKVQVNPAFDASTFAKPKV